MKNNIKHELNLDSTNYNEDFLRGILEMCMNTTPDFTIQDDIQKFLDDERSCLENKTKKFILQFNDKIQELWEYYQEEMGDVPDSAKKLFNM